MDRYEEALERAKAAIKDCGDNLGRKKMIYGIFPELAESEDERIRKIITKFVWGYANTPGAIINGDKSVLEYAKEVDAYLEKQKEQKPVKIVRIPKFRVGDIVQHVPLEKWDSTKKITYIDEHGYRFDRSHLGDPVSGGGFGFGFEDEYELVEQKPAEWSEEDEKMRKSIINILGQNTDAHEEGWAIYADEIAWLKSRRTQLKREDWTDEDSLAIKLIQNALQNYVINHGISEERREKLARWLDIHCNAYPIPAKLYPHWKPSEEQMPALKRAIEEMEKIDSNTASTLALLKFGLQNS